MLPTAIANERPDLSKIELVDADTIYEGEKTIMRFYFIDPDGGHTIQTAYVRFLFTEDTYVDLIYNYETWSVETGGDMIEILGTDAWVNEIVKRVELAFRLIDIDYDKVVIQVRAVDDEGVSSDWETWSDPFLISQHILPEEVKSEERKQLILLLLFIGFPALVALLLLSFMSRGKRKKDHPAYMELPKAPMAFP